MTLPVSMRFQLVYNGDLDEKINLIEIMPEVARILEVDAQFVGAFFNGERVILLESKEFKDILEKQKALEKIGIYSDIKPLQKANTHNTPQKKPELKPAEKTNSLYRSVFKTSDDSKSSEITLSSKRGKLDWGYIDIDEKDLRPKSKPSEETKKTPKQTDEETTKKKFDKWKG